LGADDTIHSREPISAADVLSEGEMLARDVCLQDGPGAPYQRFVAAFEHVGFSKITASVMLAGSPIIRKTAFNRYSLIGQATSPEASAESDTAGNGVDAEPDPNLEDIDLLIEDLLN